MRNTRDEDMHPDLYSQVDSSRPVCHWYARWWRFDDHNQGIYHSSLQVINSLYMMSLVCISPRLIHSYSRKAAYWVDQLRIKFPSRKVEPAYVHAAELMAAKDRAMETIAIRRQDAQTRET